MAANPQSAPEREDLHKTAEHVLARNRDWLRKNAEKVNANRRARRQANLEEVRANERAAAERKREQRLAENPVSLEELELRRRDPLREENIGQRDRVKCRECGDERTRLQDHIRKLHHMSVEEYQEKWNYPPLFAPDFGDKINKNRKEYGTSHEGDYFSGKRRELKPGEATAARLNNPPTPTMRRQRMRMTGKPRPDPTGRFYLDDARISELRLVGRSTSEIAAEVGRTLTPVTSRLKYLGFPTGHSHRFLHGEVMTKKHFRDLCEDFGVSTKIVIKEISENFSDLRPTDVLTTRRADIILAVRKRWIDKYCIRTFGRKRVREFLASELRNLPRLRALLIEPLRALRVWLRAQNGDVQPLDTLRWICKQSRDEVAASRLVGDTERRFRALIFLWPALKNLNERRPGFLEGTQTIHKVVDELLGAEYGAAPRRIGQAVIGGLTPLDPRTLQKLILTGLTNGGVGVLHKRRRGERGPGRQTPAVKKMAAACKKRGLSKRKIASLLYPDYDLDDAYGKTKQLFRNHPDIIAMANALTLSEADAVIASYQVV